MTSTPSPSPLGHYVIVASLGLAALGCSKENNITTGGPGGGSTGTELPDCSGAVPSAPPAHGGKMIAVGRLDDTCVFIDKLEVSRAEYAAFLAAGPTSTKGAPGCEQNGSLAPDKACLAEPSPSSDASLPQTCVDWCDAAAYCAWAGKSLCQGSYPRASSAETSSWYSACSNGGVSVYPPGESVDNGICNGATGSGSTMLVPVTERTSCLSKAGVQNLSGNAAEWTGACKDTTGLDDVCRVRGGGFLDNPSGLRCGSTTALARGTARRDIGFRCCAPAK